MLDKYLLHDIYHVTKNLTIMNGGATKQQIVKYVMLTAENNNRNYFTLDIDDHLAKLVEDGQIKQYDKYYEAD